MQPLYLARIEDLGRGDLVQVDCAACHRVALLTPDSLLRLGLNPEVELYLGGFSIMFSRRRSGRWVPACLRQG
jgi:hypothetical protein